jgi:hypothetical protein
MYKTLPGKFEGGVVHLNEPVSGQPNGPVLVTFLKADEQRECPLSPMERAEVRSQLAAWEADWSAPGMEVYDEP